MSARGRQIDKNQEDSTLRTTVAADLGAGGIVAQALPGYEERPAQIQMALDVATVLESGEHAIIEASTGTGKALSVDTPIPTPTGWKRMGGIVVGDTVFDETGNPTRVAAAFDTIGNRTCYEVVFSDGSSLIADAEHEWASYFDPDRVPARRLSTRRAYPQSRTPTAVAESPGAALPCTIVTTGEMAATLTVGPDGRSNHAVAVAKPLVLPDANLPVDPYFLGLRQASPIPALYLRASHAQRRALLSGLLEAGVAAYQADALGYESYEAPSQQMAEDVYELACTLGYSPVRQDRVVRLERPHLRHVIGIRAVPSCPVRCIQVEAPSHLYLAGRAMIPTHNSIAYLIPIVRSGKVSLISTANKALQEQLFYKDIPFVQKFVQPFQAALVKGMGNYLCLDRLEEEIPFQRLAPHPAFAYVEEQLNNSPEWDGDFELLPRTVSGDLRGRIAADSDQCAWRSCPSYGDCYVRKMRQRAEDAQIIVVNHTLLLLDAVMDGFLLPERDVIVIDEAHHLEEEATRAFTVTLTPSRVAALISQRRLRDHADQPALQEVMEADMNAWAALERVTSVDAKGRQPLRNPLQEGLRLATTLDTLASSLQLNRPGNLDSKEDQLFDKLVRRTRNLAAEARLVFSYDQPDERVYYIERLSGSGRRASSQLCISAGPLDVSKLLREKLFDKISTIATSATLAINQDFTFFRTRVGLDAAKEAVLPLSFDYSEQALLYLPRMRLEPAYGSANGPYLEELASEMRQLVEASRGRAFLLFSSRIALETVYGHLQKALADDYELIVQGRELGRMEMVHRFREQPRAVLFGLKSFWEGVDITGEALSLVVIDKLPFDPPDDPVQEARVARMKEAGVNWFGDYLLPQAILRLKQGIGRLLRTQTDRGVMAILDKRLYTKGYGRQVLQALPPARRTSAIEDVRRFFADA